MAIQKMTAAEAASFIKHGDQLGFSGFTAVGCPKAIGYEIAKIAEAEHAKGNPYQIGMFTGASTGDSLDGVLSRADAISIRTPYQSHKDLRNSLNKNRIHYFDYHLSQLAQDMRFGFFGKLDFAIVEVCDYTEDGELVLTTAVGNTPTFCLLAEKIFLEHNTRRPKEMRGFHDIYTPNDPPYRREIPLYTPSDRIGSPVIKVDPKKIVGVIETDLDDEIGGFTPMDDVTLKIGENVSTFLSNEIAKGTIPASFLPIQSGVGNIANAVLAGLGSNPNIPPFEMYTEVIQDSVIELMKRGEIKFASGSSFTFTKAVMDDVIANLEFYRDKLVLRPQEISNNPELVRRMGLITINTALEADIFGNINSTHVVGNKMMNGIGGSGDFARNAYMSIFTTPSTAKNGAISAFVPMVSHHDHSEHSVKVIISEYGVADLRGKSPIECAEEVIEKCAHPDYRQLLWDYLKLGQNGHTPQHMEACFAFHNAFNKTGDMRKVNWAEYGV